jgi:hypothetical protein
MFFWGRERIRSAEATSSRYARSASVKWLVFFFFFGRFEVVNRWLGLSAG